MDQQQRPLKAAELFYNPIKEMYVLFRYEGFTKGMQVSVLWWLDEELVHYETGVWQGNDNGFSFYRWDTKESPIWQPGKYTVQLFTGTTWKASGEFTVEEQLPTSSPTHTPTSTNTPTVTYTPTLTPTDTPYPTGTASQTPSSTSTNTPTRTQTPVPSATIPPTRTAKPTPTKWPTITLTPTWTARPSRTPTATNTSRPSRTIPPSLTPRSTYTIPPTITPWNTITFTPTWTPRPTKTFTPTSTNTKTLTPTVTLLPTLTPTALPSLTPSRTLAPVIASTPQLSDLLSPEKPTAAKASPSPVQTAILVNQTNTSTRTPTIKPSITPRPQLLPWVPTSKDGIINTPGELTMTAVSNQVDNRFIQDAPYYYWLATRTPAPTMWRDKVLYSASPVSTLFMATIPPTPTKTLTPTITPTRTATSTPFQKNLTPKATLPLPTTLW
jgi:hypothetical protein